MARWLGQEGHGRRAAEGRCCWGWCVGVVDVGRQVEQLETAEEKQAKEREEQAKRKQVGSWSQEAGQAGHGPRSRADHGWGAGWLTGRWACRAGGPAAVVQEEEEERRRVQEEAEELARRQRLEEVQQSRAEAERQARLRQDGLAFHYRARFDKPVGGS